MLRQTVVPHHPQDVEVFKTNSSVILSQSSRGLVQEIIPLATYLAMNLGNDNSLLSSVVLSFFLLGELSLLPMQFLFRLHQRPRIVNLLAVGQVSESRNPHINADGWLGGLDNLGWLSFAGQDDEPLVYILDDLTGFNGPFDGAAVLESDIANLGQGDATAILGEFETALRIAERPEPLFVLEPWEADVLLLFQSIEETLERLVQSLERALKHLAMNNLLVLILVLGKPFALVGIGQRLLLGLVFMDALFEGGIVQKTTGRKSGVQRLLLRPVRHQSVLECFH